MDRALPEASSPELPRRRGHPLGADSAALVVLVAISFALGSLGNLLRAKPLPWVYRDPGETLTAAVSQMGKASAKPIPAEASGEPTHEIRLEEFQQFVAAHRGLVLDARPAVFYREAHVPGAVSLPTESFAEEYPRLRATLEPHKDQPIALYCSGADCPDSQLLADALAKLGYRQLRIYTSGWDEWSQTGLPQEQATPRP